MVQCIRWYHDYVHINSKIYDDIKPVITKINKDDNIKSVINVGFDILSSQESVKISEYNKKFFSSIGIHPLYSENNSCDNLYNLVSDKVVAIGEIGLDYLNKNIEIQKQFLIKQIAIANALKLPVIIHSNNMNNEVIKVFENCIKPKYGCVFHCFQLDIESLKYIIENGFYISFAGRITYKNAKESIEIAKLIPNELFLIETDSPYISPEPVRQEINQPSNIIYIENKLCEIKNMSKIELEEKVNSNTKKLFKKMR